jgi:Tol biopolymer transport system component
MGQRPFKGSTPADTRAAILKEDPPNLTSANSTIPPALEQIVLHCLVKDPRGRFQSASDIAFSLEAISSISSSATTARPIAEPTGSGRARRVALAAIGIVVALAFGFGIFRFGERSAPAMLPSYHRITYQQGIIASAKISPDGSTVLCAARFGKNYEIYTGRLDSTGLRPLGINADQVLSISSRGELAILESAQTLDGDTVTGFLATVPLGGGAPKRMLNNVQYADWSPDGSELAIAHFIPEKHVYRLEFPVGKVLYETAGWIGHPRFSPDGKTIAFLDHPIFGDDQGFVSTIPAAGGSPKRLTQSWSSVQGLAWRPDGREVWFTASAVGPTRAMHAVSLSGSVRMVLTVPSSLTLEDMVADGRVLMNYSSERSLIMVSSLAHPEEQDISWLDDDEFFRFSSDGKQILLGDEGDAAGPRDSTFVRNIDGSSAIRIGDGDGIALSPDGQWALSRVPPDQLWLLPTGPGEARQLIQGDAKQHKVAIRADLPAEWSPDGTRIVFVGDDERTHLLSLDGNDTVLTPTGVTGFLMTPDTHYVLAQANGGKYELFSIDGGKSKPLDWLREIDQPIRFSADGKSLFVVTHDEHVRGRNLFRINFNNGRRTLLWHIQSPGNPISNDISYADVTPDGTGYAYSYLQISRTLYLVEGLK